MFDIFCYASTFANAKLVFVLRYFAIWFWKDMYHGLSDIFMYLQEMGRQLFDLKVSMTEQPSPRFFRKDAADFAQRAASWRVSWTAVDATDSNAASTPTAKMSFPDLHVAMMDFGKLLSTSFFDTCEFLRGPCCAHDENSGVVECIVVPCPAQAETEAERKFQEAQNSDCPEEVLLRATHVRSVAAGWVDDNMVACRDFWSSSVGTSANYAMSYDAEQVDVFVSHNWLQPPDWEEMMGTLVNIYAPWGATCVPSVLCWFACWWSRIKKNIYVNSCLTELVHLL